MIGLYSLPREFHHGGVLWVNDSSNAVCLWHWPDSRPVYAGIV